MPRSPGMRQIMEAEVFDARFLQRVGPCRIRQIPTKRLPTIREAVTRMVAALLLRYCDCILVQWNTL